MGNVNALWMPFTGNREFKRAPRLVARAEGINYFTPEGRPVLDGISGLWCVSAGHARKPIIEAMERQMRTLDFASSFQVGHEPGFELAERIAALAPGPLNRVFFTNSGSEACDTALKIALAYWRARGEGHRSVFVGRERGFHGVGFGGLSVGGMTANRRAFPSLLARADHLRHTYLPGHHAFARGQPQEGAYLADELEERILPLHDAGNVAAVIVEPVSGSTGVLVPPVGYLQRLREICDRHGILLIFDEVITGFGRTGALFGAERFGVVPDMICFAKSITNGAAPMGGVIVSDQVYETCMVGPEHAAELMHGYTYSAHPLSCAAGIAMLDLIAQEGLVERVQELAPYFEDRVHSLKGEPGVISIRNIGLAAAVELAPEPGQPGLRGHRALRRCFELGLLTRAPGDALLLAPPFISERSDIDRAVEMLGRAIRDVAGGAEMAQA
jgi:beta-alanine--pyruvate transaminase